ncbi:MAG: formylglycine-generating enzyme family protein [Cyclobacteriaceae bacterium]|nr:formylglycine-generating enzyme family protein [Cyclobacteriaceae bacterium]
MKEITLTFEEINYTFPMVFVKGTGERYFLFGLENDLLKISVKDFYISRFPVTQRLWKHVMGSNPAFSASDNKPVENVSYNEIISDNGFLQKLSVLAKERVSKQLAQTIPVQFRLPSESEWEYAARGGIYCGDYYVYSGSDNIEEVGWYKGNSRDESKDVGLKKSNQLGLHDMSGNIWEWCLDYYHRDTKKIPLDGSPCLEESPERVLRGGCYHNYAAHCTVMKRYEINPDYRDGCIGFRLALSIF